MSTYYSALFLVSITLFSLISDTCSSNYDNFKLVRFLPSSRKHIDSLAQLHNDSSNQIEVFKHSRHVNDSFDILVPPNKIGDIVDFANKSGIQMKIQDNNYGKNIERVLEPTRRAKAGFSPFKYQSYARIQDFLDQVQNDHSDLVQLQNVGSSYQKRPMRLVKISTNPDGNNPAIFIDAGIHAREWVAPAMALYIIYTLTSSRKAFHNELDGVDWYILPVVNPDGYEYTRYDVDNRLWRKTRSKTSRSCFGVDGNRNYAFHWGVSGVSQNPCDKETYAGAKPFSEPETQAVRNIMLQNAKKIKLYVSLHSYGQYLVYPWGFTGDSLPKTWKKLDNMARKVSDAVEKAGGNPFRVMSAGKWYPAAGGSDDFAFGAVGIPYSYTMELTDGYDFRFPEKKLNTVLPTFYEGFKSFAEQIRNEFGSK